MSTLTLVGCTSGDWEGAYIDDNLVDEGHNIDWIYVINEDNPVTKAVKLEVSSEWLEEDGCFPKLINLIPPEAYTK